MNPAVEAVSVFFPCYNDEATIARMAGGNLGIEEVTDLYERAGRLHAQEFSDGAERQG